MNTVDLLKKSKDKIASMSDEELFIALIRCGLSFVNNEHSAVIRVEKTLYSSEIKDSQTGRYTNLNLDLESLKVAS